MSPTFERFLKYTLVGTGTFVLDLVLLFLMIDVLGLHPVFSAGAAFIIAVSINYILSRRFVFKGTVRGLREGYFHFTLIAIAGFLLVVGGMHLLTTLFAWHYLVARVTVAVVTGFWNYLMNLFVNFKVAGKH